MDSDMNSISSDINIILKMFYTTNEHNTFFKLREFSQWLQNVNTAAHPTLARRAVPVIRTGAMSILVLIRKTVYFVIQAIMAPLALRAIRIDVTNMPVMASTAFIVDQQIPAVPVVQVIRINVTRDRFHCLFVDIESVM
jgi:hypothetical protein